MYWPFLLLGYGHIIDLLLRVHFKTVFIADLLDFTGSFLNVQSTFQTQNNILGGRQYIDQLEMLMHHAHAQLDRHLRGSHMYLVSIDINFS